MEISAPEISFIASMEAAFADLAPFSNFSCIASTTTMASSTTIAMASTKAQSVRRLILNPITFNMKNVPIKATGMAIAGISVERKSCKNMNTTKNTSTKASSKVFITSCMEAKRKSLESSKMSYVTPGGKFLFSASSKAFTSLIICVALEPAD